MRRVTRQVRSTMIVGLKLTLVTLITLVTVNLAPSRAGAAEDCRPVPEPSSSFLWDDGVRSIALDFDLAANSVASVEATRTLVVSRTDGFPPDALDAVHAYLDSLVRWYGYLGAACAQALPYEGPYTNEPAGVTGPYGFGGVDVALGPPVVVVITDGDTATVEVAHTVDTADSGRDLAQSGSESVVLAYFGAGLIAFGAVALGTRRRIS